MDLSVIIVNYNVKYFLEQCLHAVKKASLKTSIEIIVVDNNSADGSCQMVAEKFPEVILLVNKTNTGFARANNQAIRRAAGRYVLLLNPDTVVQEDTFLKCMEYMDHHPDAGSLGVKMINGRGRFLPESRRALPTPQVAFCKVFGLSALFPKSKVFGRYHLGFLNRDTIHEADVISGAFMFIRKAVLDQVGLLDEAFFMYGEDIDLSYRIQLSGYKNVYFPSTTIIHYKGESTKKGSFNYIMMFYRAMIIFARKHFSGSAVRFYTIFIFMAIYFRAMISILGRFISAIINPMLDALIVFAGYAAFLPVWEKIKFGQPSGYPDTYLRFVVPSYIAIWIFSVYMAEGYEKKTKITRILRGVIGGSLVILLIYALLPENMRFSRALILLGTIWTMVTMIAVRYMVSRIFSNSFSMEWSRTKKRFVIICTTIREGTRVFSIINQTREHNELIGFVCPSQLSDLNGFIGHLGQIEDIMQINQADELVFCAAEISSRQIIKTMLQFTESGIEFKIAPPESLSVIGSNSSETSGELYVLHFNTLSRALIRQRKRLFDIAFSIILIPSVPVTLFLVKNPLGLMQNIATVLAGLHSWVGYFQSTGGHHPGLPGIKPGILTPADLPDTIVHTDEQIERMNLQYARDYRVTRDLGIIIKGFRNLGRKGKVLTNG